MVKNVIYSFFIVELMCLNKGWMNLWTISINFKLICVKFNWVPKHFPFNWESLYYHYVLWVEIKFGHVAFILPILRWIVLGKTSTNDVFGIDAQHLYMVVIFIGLKFIVLTTRCVKQIGCGMILPDFYLFPPALRLHKIIFFLSILIGVFYVSIYIFFVQFSY